MWGGTINQLDSGTEKDKACHWRGARWSSSESLHDTIPAQCWAQDLARGLNYIQGLHW